MQRFGGAPNNLASHYQQYPTHSQTHTPGLPPPSLGSNPGFMNANSMSNPFAASGYGVLNVNNDGSGLGMPGGTGLASQAAQLSFASGGIHQQQQNGLVEMQRGSNKARIRDVWAGNLAEEMGILRHLVDRYPYVAMVRTSFDTWKT
jgi:CCR4-NOT transcription complex subunit 7/8